MMKHRHGHTGREMAQAITWTKVARKHYRHISGVEVRYDCNRWGWEVVGEGLYFTVLYAAKHWAEHVGLNQMPTAGGVQ